MSPCDQMASEVCWPDASRGQADIVDSAVDQLKKMLGREDCTVILTGSYATGRVMRGSDIDLIVVAQIPQKLIGEFRLEQYGGVVVDYQVHSTGRLLQEISRGNLVFCSMLVKSALLTGDDGFYRRLVLFARSRIEDAAAEPGDARAFLMLKRVANMLEDIRDAAGQSDPSSVLLLRNALVDYSFHVCARRAGTVLTNVKHRMAQLESLDTRASERVSALLRAPQAEIVMRAEELSAYLAVDARAVDTTWAMEEQVVRPERRLAFHTPPRTEQETIDGI